MPVHTFTVAMTCGGCSGAVERILTRQKGDAASGVEDFTVDLDSKTVTVTSSTLSAEAAGEIIKKAGKTTDHVSTE